MTDCARGCLIRNKHIPGCDHTHECPHDCPNHCDGCSPKPAETGNYCWRCTNTFRANLTELPDLIDAAAAMPAGRLMTRAKDHHTSDRRPTKVDQMSPSPAHDAADEATTWTYQWALTLADHLHHKGPFTYQRNGIPKMNHRTFVAYLLGNIDTVLTAYWSGDIWDETRTLHRRLTQATGRDQLTHRIKDPCPSCDHRTLQREDGASKVICRNRDCNRVWTETEYARLAVVAAS